MQIESTYFNEAVSGLTKALPKYRTYFKSLRIDYSIDESESRHSYRLSYSDEIGENKEIVTASSGSEGVDWMVHDFLRYAFLELVVSKLKFKDFASYVYESICSIYKMSSIEHFTNHSIVKYCSLKFDPGKTIFSAVLHEDVFIFLPDGASTEDFHYQATTSGSQTFFCKDSESAFNKKDALGMFFLSPAFEHGYKLYMKALGFRSPSPIFAAVDLLRGGGDSTSYELQKSLSALPSGDGLAFEQVCRQILEYIFADCYETLNVREQVQSFNGIRRRDFIVDNLHPRNPLLKSLSEQGVTYLLFDAKNYEKEMSISDLDTFFSYIQENPKFGKVGILLTRKGIKDNAKTHIFHRLIGNHDEVIVLDQSDLSKMIDLRSTARDPLQVIEDKITELRLQR